MGKKKLPELSVKQMQKNLVECAQRVHSAEPAKVPALLESLEGTLRRFFYNSKSFYATLLQILADYIATHANMADAQTKYNVEMALLVWYTVKEKAIKQILHQRGKEITTLADLVKGALFILTGDGRTRDRMFMVDMDCKKAINSDTEKRLWLYEWGTTFSRWIMDDIELDFTQTTVEPKHLVCKQSSGTLRHLTKDQRLLVKGELQQQWYNRRTAHLKKTASNG